MINDADKKAQNHAEWCAFEIKLEACWIEASAEELRVIRDDSANEEEGIQPSIFLHDERNIKCGMRSDGVLSSR